MLLENDADRLARHRVATNLPFVKKNAVSAKRNKSKHNKMRSACTLESPSVAFSGCGRADWSARMGLGLSGRAEPPLLGTEMQPQVGNGAWSFQGRA